MCTLGEDKTEITLKGLKVLKDEKMTVATYSPSPIEVWKEEDLTITVSVDCDRPRVNFACTEKELTLTQNLVLFCNLVGP